MNDSTDSIAGLVVQFANSDVHYHHFQGHGPQTSHVQKELSAAQLRHAAKLARLSGLCYRPTDELSESLEKEGLHLISCGQTHFTRWYVADGPAADLSSVTGGPLANDTSTSGKDCLGNELNSVEATANTPNEGASRTRRIVMMRGVVWRTGEFNTRLWQDMMKFWPATFEGEFTQPRDILVSHSGMRDMAQELFTDLRPFLSEANTRRQHVTFGGHSLGGAFALLMACMSCLRIQMPSDAIECYAFGAPPVLSLAEKSVARNIMEVCGLPQGCVKSFVLDNDPIPRAMLSVDPTFALLKQSTPVSFLLETRRRLFGSGASFTPERFLYENVGEVYLIRWSAEAGQRVSLLAPSEMEEQLKLAVEELMRTPAALMQALLDHSHGSYSQELYAAARQLERR
ncbi:hypothetical protein COCOBI_01-3140 [Coccomyxa sp. Obi]|nr:hypothetical protein COCOBI_01-3140 [Coccomyxa sp. Obi]